MLPHRSFAIYGRGVAALTCATVLLEAGFRIEIVAPSGAPRPISHLAGGMLAPYCEGEAAPSCIVQAGLKAISWWRDHVSGVVQNGTLVVAPFRDQDQLKLFARDTSNHVEVTPSEYEPDLGSTFRQGLLFPDEAHLDPVKALTELEGHLRDHGVKFTDRAALPQSIDCRGISASDVLQDLRGVRGEMLIVRNPAISFSRPIRLLHPRFPCYVVPRDDHHFMIGATMIETADPSGPSARSVMELLSSAYTLHRSFGQAEIIKIASGVRPSFLDNIPRFLRKADTWHINGMYRHGFLMAPHCATELCQTLLQPSENVS